MSAEDSAGSYAVIGERHAAGTTADDRVVGMRDRPSSPGCPSQESQPLEYGSLSRFPARGRGFGGQGPFSAGGGRRLPVGCAAPTARSSVSMRRAHPTAGCRRVPAWRTQRTR